MFFVFFLTPCPGPSALLTLLSVLSPTLDHEPLGPLVPAPWTLKAQVHGWLANRGAERGRNIKGIQGDGIAYWGEATLKARRYL